MPYNQRTSSCTHESAERAGRRGARHVVQQLLLRLLLLHHDVDGVAADNKNEHGEQSRVNAQTADDVARDKDNAPHVLPRQRRAHERQGTTRRLDAVHAHCRDATAAGTGASRRRAGDVTLTLRRCLLDGRQPHRSLDAGEADVAQRNLSRGTLTRPQSRGECR
jgi:hypothetical protein